MSESTHSWRDWAPAGAKIAATSVFCLPSPAGTMQFSASAAPMQTQDDSPITRMLNDICNGRSAASDELLQCVYQQLRAIAQRRMASERPGHTLQATALVHEAYVRLLGDHEVTWRDRSHFYLAAAEAMRRILVDHARRRGREKRGGNRTRVPLSVCDLAAADDPQQILALDDALQRLQGVDAHAAELVRLRFFAGLSIEETAAALGVSERTVKHEWTYARARLFRFLEEAG
jgi:RNA polymerase sigma factor (TIGR02999 family)